MSTENTDVRELSCPKCGSTMERILCRKTVVDRCRGCGGIWFDISEHEDLKKIEGSEKIDTGCRERAKDHDKVQDIDCPGCGHRMVSLVAPRRRDIRYEKCSICYGVYFDAGEFDDFKQEMSFLDILASALIGTKPE